MRPGGRVVPARLGIRRTASSGCIATSKVCTRARSVWADCRRPPAMATCPSATSLVVRGANVRSTMSDPFGNPLCFVDETSLFTARLIECIWSRDERIGTAICRARAGVAAGVVCDHGDAALVSSPDGESVLSRPAIDQGPDRARHRPHGGLSLQHRRGGLRRLSQRQADLGGSRADSGRRLRRRCGSRFRAGGGASRGSRVPAPAVGGAGRGGPPPGLRRRRPEDDKWQSGYRRELGELPHVLLRTIRRAY